MAKKRSRRKTFLSIQARRALREILKWTQAKLGRDATLRYEDLMSKPFVMSRPTWNIPARRTRATFKKASARITRASAANERVLLLELCKTPGTLSSTATGAFRMWSTSSVSYMMNASLIGIFPKDTGKRAN
jgi:hypothetical protein